MSAFEIQLILTDRVVSDNVSYTFLILKQLLIQSVGGHIGLDYDHLLDMPFPVAIEQLNTWIDLQEEIKKEQNKADGNKDSLKGKPKDLATAINEWGFKIGDLQDR